MDCIFFLSVANTQILLYCSLCFVCVREVHHNNIINFFKRWGLPGGPVVKTPCFHCRAQGFDPWLGNKDPACHSPKINKLIN